MLLKVTMVVSFLSSDMQMVGSWNQIRNSLANKRNTSCLLPEIDHATVLVHGS